MNKRRILISGFVFSLLILFTACTGERQDRSTKKNHYTIGFSQIGAESEWRIANTSEMLEAYSNHPRFTLLFSDAQQRRENQIAAIQSFIQQKVDAIILAPTVTTGWDVVLTEAKEAGIPVIIINRAARMISGNIEDYTVCRVAADNVYAGELLALTLIDAFKDESGPVYIVEITGTREASATIERSRGIHNILSNQNRIVVRYSQSGDYNRAAAKEIMEIILDAAQADGIKIQGLIAHSDDMAIGASQALEEAGLIPGREIVVMGIGGASDAFEAMKQGRYTATVENPLGYGEKTIEILLDLLDNGKKPDDYWVVLKNNVYTADEDAR